MYFPPKNLIDKINDMWYNTKKGGWKVFGKSFVKIRHGNQYTIEDLDHVMKQYGCTRQRDELTEEFLKKGTINYYDELHCYCVIFTGCVFEKRSAILSTIVIDEIIMLW